MASTNTAAAYIQTAVNNELETLLSTGDGNRNNQLNESAFKIGTLPIPRDDKQAMLEDAANRLGIPENEALGTIKSGLDAGEKNPRSMEGIGDGGTVRIHATTRPSKPYKARTSVHVPALEPDVLARLETAQKALTARWPVPELAERGFTLELAQEFGFGLAQNGDTLIPASDPNGRIVALKRRHCAPNADPRYSWAAGGKGLPATCSPTYGNAGTAFWIEGELSALVAWAALRQAGLNIDVQGLGGTSGKPWDVGHKHVLIYCDGDEAGIQALEKWAKIALEAGARSVKTLEPLPDLEDFCDIAARDGLEALSTTLKTMIATTAEVDPWPDPEPFTDALEPVPALHLELMPEPFRASCAETATDLSIPFEFVAVPALATFGNFIGRRVGLRLKRHSEWTVYGNSYVALVGPPSSLKSPTLEAALRPVRAVEATARAKYLQQKNEDAANTMILESKLNALKSTANKEHKGLSEGERRNLIAETLSSLAKSETTEPRFVLNDITDSKLIRVLSENPNGIQFVRDEFSGFLEQIERGEHFSKPLYLELWSGDAHYTLDRVGDGSGENTIRVDGGCLGITGGIQPSKMQKYLSESYAQGSSDGFFARFLPCWPDSFGEFVFSDRWADGDARKKANALYRWVADTDFTKQGAIKFVDRFADSSDEDAPTRPPYYTLDDEAYTIFEEFYTERMRTMKRDGFGDPNDEFTGKSGKHLGTLALTLHVIRVQSGEIAPGPVDAQTMLMAIGWLEFYAAHWKKIMSLAKQSSPGAMLAARVKRGEVTDEMTVREIGRKQWAGLRTPELVQVALDHLEASGWLKLEDASSGGRPSVIVRLNPKLEGLKAGGLNV
jgi:Protein of unknown function (DUF3987)